MQGSPQGRPRTSLGQSFQIRTRTGTEGTQNLEGQGQGQGRRNYKDWDKDAFFYRFLGQGQGHFLGQVVFFFLSKSLNMYVICC